ncbi:protein CURVATURE THYLAKOID 1D, chloroplastic [Sorghum bicolor]|uniref:Cyanobacterial aminoacyl-tRNA synthetase CAAD domain-containing protein n=1 Tax=Sorghum bicolor TaxID=4558 RepID=C5X2Z5_SORBI|nr:protein CURVATURE THYLAKOID 1D, chloroplastic [Sorghum bicolor]EER99031.1 hypothetical protein SORBI_3002G230800 [Sorghum bicolor]|eukprot:XP_002462510.1 protein CURVATURE THYLAKOID 1D, chloroplastic [Sorghum bicolor]
MALAARAALVRVLPPPRPSPISQPKQQLKQGLGGRGGASLAVRAKDSDDFGALLSEKPAAPAQAPAKRDGWEGFGREASSVEVEEKEEVEVEVQGEPASSWGVLNQIGVELDSDKSYSALVYGTSAVVAIWISSIVVSALDSVPLVPQVMEVVGLGFTIWFTSRYLIFKENRDELITRVSSIKKQILGSDN